VFLTNVAILQLIVIVADVFRGKANALKYSLILGGFTQVSTLGRLDVDGIWPSLGCLSSGGVPGLCSHAYGAGYFCIDVNMFV